jgi:hypothetical protein
MILKFERKPIESEGMDGRAQIHLSTHLTIPNSPSSLQYCNVNPFLFIRGFSCPRSVQTSLTQYCINLTIPGFPYNLFTVSFNGNCFLKKKHRSSIGLEIRPQSVFTAFRALLPSVNYSAEGSSRVWQPAADSNVRLAYFFFLLQACQTAIIVCSWLPRPIWQVQVLKNCAKRPLLSTAGCCTLSGHNTAFISDE